MILEVHIGTLLLMVGIPMAALVFLGIHWMKGHCARCLIQRTPEPEPKLQEGRPQDKGASGPLRCTDSFGCL